MLLVACLPAVLVMPLQWPRPPKRQQQGPAGRMQRMWPPPLELLALLRSPLLLLLLLPLPFLSWHQQTCLERGVHLPVLPGALSTTSTVRLLL